MVRFFYKVDTQQKAKILRKVSAKSLFAIVRVQSCLQVHSLDGGLLPRTTLSSMQSCSMLAAKRAAVPLRTCAASPHISQRLLNAQVVFPLVLDLYEFCTEDYKMALEGPRKAWQEAEDKRAGLERAAKAAAKSASKDEKAPEVSCPSAEVSRLLCFGPVTAVDEQFETARAHVLLRHCRPGPYL